MTAVSFTATLVYSVLIVMCSEVQIKLEQMIRMKQTVHVYSSCIQHYYVLWKYILDL